MLISFFLTPKQDVVILSDKSTMRQALEKMEYHRYSAVPIIDGEGKYISTLTEGDLLWKIKKTKGMTFEETEKIPILDVPRHIQNIPVPVDAKMEELIELAKTQNFVPVVDDNQVFIGIVKRSDIIEYCAKLLQKDKTIER